MLEIKDIPLNSLRESTFNHRQQYDQAKLEELAGSFSIVGVLQPLTVRNSGSETEYEIIAGSRRYRAAKIAKLRTLPAIVQYATDQEVLEIQLVENIQREDLSPLEEANSYQQLIDKAGYKVANIATRVSKSPELIYGRLKLLELDVRGRRLLSEGKLSAEHGVLLARVKDPKQQRKLLECVTRSDRPLSVRELRHQINECEDQDKKNARVQSEMAKARAGGTQTVRISDHYISGKSRGVYGPDDWSLAGKKKCDDLALGWYVSTHYINGAAALVPTGRSAKVCLKPKACPIHKIGPTSRRAPATESERKAIAERLAAQRKVKAGNLARLEAIGLVVGKVKRLDTPLLRELTAAYASDVWHEVVKSICERREWTPRKNVGYAGNDYRGEIDKHIAVMRERELVGLLVEIAMHAYAGADLRLSRRYRVDLAILKKQHLATLNVAASGPAKKKATKKIKAKR